METTLRYFRVNEQFFVFSRRAPYMVLRDVGTDVWSDSHRERERIIAEFCVDLIDKYHYRLAQLHIRELIPIVSQEGWKYPEADILVEGVDGNPRLLVKALGRTDYENNLNAGIEELLMLARAIPSRKTTSLFVIAYTRWYEDHQLNEKYTVINSSVFPTIEAWIGAGRPIEEKVPLFGENFLA
ncbi:MAG: hypothetical protein A3J58_03385 [Candidatus Sungbacteria bacterium RIFCSPHIGHO2_02_FULL_52_23]|uniref:Uncharacterized protein n=1 Tax=Candidatus Sungbacteria bacterium RIFCSPHIGHO2_02_FULL_52_23 TaxID=1802274 RepID=A0A1G2KX60_9BACT|nr:MAG: hypothetical protein A3J58_03385 [Candidatus Sungbacteria bacterium RIFCSPHIGHO2_02_FULL_52_23]